MEQNKTNKILIFICVIFGLVILGLGGYFIYDKFIANNDTEEKDSQKITELDFYAICSQEEQKGTCKRTLTVDNKDIEISVIATERPDDPGYYEFTKLQVAEKVIYSNETNIKYIKSFEDLLVLETYCIYCGGESAGLPTTVIIDKNGKKVFDIYEINFEKDYYYDNKYEIKDNKLIVTASRVGYFADYGPFPSADCYFEGEYVSGNTYSEVANKIAKIEYEAEYLGNNKFSIIKKGKEIKFGELYSKEQCIREYEEYEKIMKELDEE